MGVDVGDVGDIVTVLLHPEGQGNSQGRYSPEPPDLFILLTG